MKKIYFSIFVFIFAKTISAQQYFPMLDSANTWSYSNLEIAIRINPNAQFAPCSYPTNNGVGPTFTEYTTTDTIINSLTYKTVMNNMFNCIEGFIREDTAARKIYFIDNLSSNEKLLYDFSMQPGDTITCTFPNNVNGYISGLYTLDSITNVHIFAGSRRAFWFSCHSSPGSLVFSWVESVGNLNDMIYPYFYNYSSSLHFFSSCPGAQHQFDQFMICFEHQSKVYFDSCTYAFAQNNPCCSVAFDSCDYFSFIGGINELSSLHSADVFPNPCAGKTFVSLDVKQSDNFEILVRDVSGKKIMKEIPLGKIESGKKEIELDLSSFANGIYLVEVKSSNGSIFQKLIIEK